MRQPGAGAAALFERLLAEEDLEETSLIQSHAHRRHNARVVESGGIVLRIWWYELRSALLMNERRGRITQQQVSDTLTDGLDMGISIDEAHEESLLLDLARCFELSVYDAAYLETALRRNLPLATLDHRLRRAAEVLGVALLHNRD